VPETSGKPDRTASTRKRRRASAGRYAPVEREGDAEAPRKKNLRLHQSKIDEARAILGTATETDTIEAALDLVVFRQELAEGVRAMRGTNLVNLFDAAEE
jgi:hypothetical protein